MLRVLARLTAAAALNLQAAVHGEARRGAVRIDDLEGIWPLPTRAAALGMTVNAVGRAEQAVDGRGDGDRGDRDQSLADDVAVKRVRDNLLVHRVVRHGPVLYLADCRLP